MRTALWVMVYLGIPCAVLGLVLEVRDLVRWLGRRRTDRRELRRAAGRWSPPLEEPDRSGTPAGGER